MKIALASAKFIDCDLKFNLSQIEKYMRQAKTMGADLLCFGESYLQGFECLEWDYETDKNRAVPLSSPIFNRLSRWTAEIGVDLLLGFIEAGEDALYSSCAVLSGGEWFHHYRRISRGWKDPLCTDSHYREGREAGMFSYKGKNCLIALCGDLWDYPERFRQGADLLFWPVFVDFSIDEWRNIELADYVRQANTVCPDVLFINSIADGKTSAFGGCYHFAGGKIRESLPMGKEGLLIVDIEKYGKLQNGACCSFHLV